MNSFHSQRQWLHLGRWWLLGLFSVLNYTQPGQIFFCFFTGLLCVMCSDKQLIQYTSCPLLAFLDGCTPPPEIDQGTSSTSSSNTHLQPCSSSSASGEAELHSELLDTSLELKQPVRSSLIRLEPLTEAEASEETLFYLCELSPAGPEADSTALDRVWAGTTAHTTDYIPPSSRQYWHCVLIYPYLCGHQAGGRIKEPHTHFYM